MSTSPIRRESARGSETPDRPQDREGPHHSNHCAQQSNHGGHDADDREIAILGSEDLRFAQSMLDEGRFYGILSPSNALESAFEDSGEVGLVGSADFPSFLVIASADGGLERFQQASVQVVRRAAQGKAV